MEGSTKSGYWKATGETEQIDHHNEIVGFKRIFVFYCGEAPTAKESSWMMNEFSVNPSLVQDNELDFRTNVTKFCIAYVKLGPIFAYRA